MQTKNSKDKDLVNVRKRNRSELSNNESESNNDCSSEPQTKKQKNYRHIQQRYYNDECIDDMVSKIAKDIMCDQDVYNEIIEYLCRIGVCVICIYRICHRFPLKLEKNTIELLMNLEKLYTPKDIERRHCFICDDMFHSFYKYLQSSNELSTALSHFEYDPLLIEVKSFPTWTIRDYFVVHHLHRAIDNALKVIELPPLEHYCNTHLMQTMVQLFVPKTKGVVIENEPEMKCNDNGKPRKDQCHVLDMTVYPFDCMRDMYLSPSDLENTKQCDDYVFLKTFINEERFKQYHYLKNLKMFLKNLDSDMMSSKYCKSIDSDMYLQFPLMPYKMVPLLGKEEDTCDVKVKIERKKQIMIAGNYNKYSREVSQTKFQYSKTSVKEIIDDQMQKFNEFNDDMFECDKVAFQAGGREDMNVKMLGNGRPFILQLTNPRKTISLSSKANLKKFADFCNSKCDGMIAIHDLRVETAAHQKWLKETEQSKKKKYKCVCWVSKLFKNQKELDDIKDKCTVWKNLGQYKPMKLKQWTPIRVLNRRSLMEREKHFYSLDITWIAPHWVECEIVSQAGTYIKEFCHGDRGRTNPNLLSLLGCESVNIVQLDVTGILYD